MTTNRPGKRSKAPDADHAANSKKRSPSPSVKRRQSSSPIRQSPADTRRKIHRHSQLVLLSLRPLLPLLLLWLKPLHLVLLLRLPNRIVVAGVFHRTKPLSPCLVLPRRASNSCFKTLDQCSLLWDGPRIISQPGPKSWWIEALQSKSF